MYAIIAGAGKVGRNLARELISKDHEVTLIEASRARYLALEEEFEHAIQYGDATELWVLERAGMQRADLAIAVSPATTRTTCSSARSPRRSTSATA